MQNTIFSQPIWQHLFQNWQKGQLHHALLFSGEADEKIPIAHALVSRILCRAPNDGPSCGSCQNCLFLKDHYHPDLRHLGEDPDNPPKIDEVREVLQFISQMPHTAQKKVVLIEHADLLNIPTQNALLKILEEPPAFVQFILLTEKIHLLLPTIRSRCLQFVFQHVRAEQALENLQALISEHPDYSGLAACPQDELIALLALANYQCQKVLAWAQSPVWQYRQDLARVFIQGNSANNTHLPSLFQRNSEQVLYFIYRALSEWIQLSMRQSPVNNHIISQLGLGMPHSSNPRVDLDYLEKIEAAIRSVTEMPGLNKLLMFQSLFATRITG